jgi:HK97 family phage portal protein
MGLVDRINSRLDVQRAADPVTMEEFGYLLGQQGGNKSLAGVSVTPTRALGITAWYSGVRYLAETVASLPCFTFRDTPSGRSRRADPGWKGRPDVDVPWASWVEFQMMSLLHRGDGFSFKLRNGLDQVTGLRSLHPDRVRVGRHPDTGRKVFQVRDMEPLFTTREILHIPGLSYDGLRGIDVIRYHAGSLGTTAAADEYAARFFDAGSHLNHYIQLRADLTREQAIEQREQFQAFHRGLQNAHELGLLGGDATLKTVGLDPAQTQLLETRKFGIIQVAQILRIPPHKLYELTRSTNNNIEHQSIEAVVDSIRPWVVRFETHINFDPDLQPVNNFQEFEVEGLLRGDMASRYAAYAQGIQFGFLNRNEPRRKENLEQHPELDPFLVPVNMYEAGTTPPVPATAGGTQ